MDHQTADVLRLQVICLNTISGAGKSARWLDSCRCKAFEVDSSTRRIALMNRSFAGPIRLWYFTTNHKAQQCLPENRLPMPEIRDKP